MIRFTALISALVLSACSVDTGNCTDVNQAKIYQYYSASYDAKDDSTRASAQFRFAGATGTTLLMDGKCAVTHDTITLEKSALSSLLGTSYSGSKTGYLAASTFTFTNNAGASFVNAITNPSTIALSSPASTVSRASDLTISFTPAVAANESVLVHVEYVSTPTAVTRSQATQSTSTVGATSATISKSALAEMSSDGSVYLYARRHYSKDLDQKSESEGGSLNYYYSSPRTTATLGN